MAVMADSSDGLKELTMTEPPSDTVRKRAIKFASSSEENSLLNKSDSVAAVSTDAGQQALKAVRLACLPSSRRNSIDLITLTAEMQRKRSFFSGGSAGNSLDSEAIIPFLSEEKTLKKLRATGFDSEPSSRKVSLEMGEEKNSKSSSLTSKRISIFPDSHTKSSILKGRLRSVNVPMKEKKAAWENYLHFDPSLVASAAWRGWERKKAQLYNVWNHLDVWSSHFKEIEGRFGSATASYFRFARWLVFLNLYTFLMTMLIIVIPFHVSSGHHKASENLDYKGNSSVFLQQAYNCSITYEMTTQQNMGNESASDKALDFFVGTGWMERTSMFYGLYQNSTFGTGKDKYNYNMSLAYILTIIITFFVTFLLILANASNSVKETVMDTQEHSTVHFTNSVLCGWDFCIYNEKMANSKKSILFQEFKADLLEQSKRLQRQNRTNRQKAVLMLIRVVINIIVIGILGGTLYLVFFTTDKLIDLRKLTKDPVLLLLIQMLPSLTITVLNFIIPMIFYYLVRFEDYWPSFELKITLARTVLVRLSSLGVLIFSLYYTLLWNSERSEKECPQENKKQAYCCGNLLWASLNDTRSNNDTFVQCWETYVGQQFYKLCIVDFAVLVIATFFVDFPRKFIYDRFKDKSKIVYELCHMEFDIPRSVLDIVYSQMLSWMGMYFAPLLPAINLIKVCLVFYIKKLTLMKNYSPPQHVYKVSKSNSFFNIILLLSFVLVSITIGYLAGNIPPSKSCGPFRVYSVDDYVVWKAVTDLISSWPDEAQQFFFFFGTTAFFVPCFILLSLMMYYYWAVGQGYKRMEEILQEQLRLEGKDKQFLLARVNEVIRQSNLNSQ